LPRGCPDSSFAETQIETAPASKQDLIAFPPAPAGRRDQNPLRLIGAEIGARAGDGARAAQTEAEEP